MVQSVSGGGGGGGAPHHRKGSPNVSLSQHNHYHHSHNHHNRHNHNRPHLQQPLQPPKRERAGGGVEGRPLPSRDTRIEGPDNKSADDENRFTEEGERREQGLRLGGGRFEGKDGNVSSVPVIRLLVLGGHGVGKSAVTVRYLTRRFIGEYKSQVDIIYRQTLQVEGLKIHVEIIDISSRPGDDTVPSLEICQCDCYLVVYSVAERHTFVTANHLLRAIFKLRPHVKRPPITLLGNKQDLEHSRQVTPEEGATTSRTFGCDFAEVSVAETCDGIIPIFNSLIQKARQLSSWCPRYPTALVDLSVCCCVCQHSFLVGSHTCRHCGCSDACLKKCDGDIVGARSETNSSCPPLQVIADGPNDVITAEKRNQERLTKPIRENSCRSSRKSIRKSNKSRLVRSSSSPLQKVDSRSGQISSANKPLRKKPSETPLSSSSSSSSSSRCRSPEPPNNNENSLLSKENKKSETIVPVHHSEHNLLCRSLSSPEAGTVGKYLEDFPESSESKATEQPQQPPHPKGNTKIEGFFASLVVQEPKLSLLSRGRSFVLDSNKTNRSLECSCRTQNRTSSFKSSGKVEIVTIRKPSVKMEGKNENTIVKDDDKNDLLLQGGTEKPKSAFNNNSFSPANGSLSSPSSPVGLKAPRTPTKGFTFDSLELGGAEDACSSPAAGGRQRKFSVFGVGRALGNFLSKGSMPDLPRATANICDKFGSLKRTIKKRSV